MTKLHYSIKINAPVEKVWDTMLSDETYREWTEVFSPGSRFEGSWDEGSDIRFLGPEEDGKSSGMISRIKENREHEFVSIEHLGMIVNDVEDLDSEKVNKWKGAHENYTFNEVDGGTELLIDIDVDEEEMKMFEEMWPKALEKLKELSEK